MATDDARWTQVGDLLNSLTQQLQGLAAQNAAQRDRLSQVEQRLASQQSAAPATPGNLHQNMQANRLVGKNKEPEVLRAKTMFRSWARHYKTVAGAKDLQFKSLLEWAETQTEPISMADLALMQGVDDAEDLANQVYASLILYTEDGTEARTIVDNVPEDNGAEAWRRLVRQYDPQTESANISLMAKILAPPRGKFATITHLVGK